MKTAVLLAALTGCWSASQPTPTTNTDVKVDLASVSLADDCPDAAAADIPAPSQGSCAGPGMCPDMGRRRCEQTMLQVTVDAKAATELHIKKVELLDPSGKVLGTLAARKPTQWSDNSGAYVAWNEKVPGDKPLKASYSLSAPDFGDNGPDPSVTYKVRVTFAVGGKDQVIEKEASVSANVEAPVVT